VPANPPLSQSARHPIGEPEGPNNRDHAHDERHGHEKTGHETAPKPLEHSRQSQKLEAKSQKFEGP
jgi:hypothetical protein